MKRTPIFVTDIFFDQLSKGRQLTADDVLDRVKQVGHAETSVYKTKMKVGEVLLFAFLYKMTSHCNAPITESEMSMDTLMLSDLEQLEKDYLLMRYIHPSPNRPRIPVIVHKDEIRHTPEKQLKVYSSETYNVAGNIPRQFEKPGP